MPENQSQPNLAGNPANPGGEPQLQPQPDPESRSFDRPSDTEAAHSSEEGGAVRDPRLATDAAMAEQADQNHGSLAGHKSRDPREDYGKAQDAEGTDRGTAGAEFADRMPSDPPGRGS